MLTEFPRTAVIYPGCEEEARILMEFLADQGFEWDGDGDLIRGFESCWKGNDTCFDIETNRLSVCGCDKDYYIQSFREDYPELAPEDEFFLCSVNDFIVKCGGKNRYPDFDVAEDSDIIDLLGL